jgi:hypothetical protein
MACQDPCATPPCCPDPATLYNTTGCLDFPDTNCVIYGHDPLAPLNVATGDNMTQILTKLSTIVAGLSPATFASFNYGCLSSQNWTTEQAFVQGISSIVCQILGSQVPGSITSLTTINNNITTNTTNIGNLTNQNLLSCFGTLASLVGPTQNLGVLLTAVQQQICNNNSSLQGLVNAGAGVGNSFANTGHNVILSGSGSGSKILSGDVRISAQALNGLTAISDGLYIPAETDNAVVATTTLNLSTSGTHQRTITGNVKVSAVTGNALAITTDGLYVNPTKVFVQSILTLISSDPDLLSYFCTQLVKNCGTYVCGTINGLNVTPG